MTNAGSIDAVVSRWLASVKITAHPIPILPQGGTVTQILMLSALRRHDTKVLDLSDF